MTLHPAHAPVIRHRHRTTLTLLHPSTVRTLHTRRVPPTIQQQQALLPLFPPLLQRLPQQPRQHHRASGLGLLLLAEIDDMHLGQLRPVHPLPQPHPQVSLPVRIVGALQRRRRTTQNHRGSLNLSPHHRQIPRVVPRRLPLFVTPIVLLIHDDQAEALQRGKKSRSRPDHHPRAPLPDLVPRLPPLRRRLGTMQHANPYPLARQPTPESRHRLRRQGNLRH